MAKNSITQKNLASLVSGSFCRARAITGLEGLNPTVLIHAHRCFPCHATEEMVYLLLNVREGKRAPDDFLAATLVAYEKVLVEDVYPLFSRAFSALTGLDAAREVKKFIRFISFLGRLRDPRTFLEAATSSTQATSFAAMAIGRSSTHELAKTVLRAELFDEKEDIVHSGINPYYHSDVKLFDVITPAPKPKPEVTEPVEEPVHPLMGKSQSMNSGIQFSKDEHPYEIIAGFTAGTTHIEVPHLESVQGSLHVVSDGSNLFISAAAGNPETVVLISERFLWLERWYDFSNRHSGRSEATSIDLKLATEASSELKHTIVIPVGHMSPYTTSPWLDL